MLTKPQANAVADALLEGSRAERIARFDERARQVPFPYRSRSFSQIAAWRQAQLLAEAQKTAGFTWPAAAFVACLLLLASLLWRFSEHSHSTSALLSAIPATTALGVLFRVLLVKLRLQELLLQELAPKPAMAPNPSIERTA